MFKFVLSMVLLLASLTGLASAAPPDDRPQSIRTTAEAGGRWQYFGPYTKKVAEDKQKAWEKHSYTCEVELNPKGYPAGWYVKVYFQE
jgi:hypothetical protein